MLVGEKRAQAAALLGWRSLECAKRCDKAAAFAKHIFIVVRRWHTRNCAQTNLGVLSAASFIEETSVSAVDSELHYDYSVSRLCDGKSLLDESADKQLRFVKLIFVEKAYD